MRTITDENKLQVIDEYVEYIVEGLDWDTMVAMCRNSLTNNLVNLSPDKVTECINATYPDFLIEDE
jgi:hypothetical protein